MLLSEQFLKQAELKYSALKDPEPSVPTSRIIPTFPDLTATKHIDLSFRAESLEANRKMTLEYKAPEPTDFAFERAIGKNDSVYSNFIELVMEVKAKVGKIIVKSGGSIKGYATGFMVSPRLMLTNWHVFQQAIDTDSSEIQFGYEFDIYGKEKVPVTFGFSPQEFFYANQTLDYCLVAVSPRSKDGGTDLRQIGYLYLDPSMGKLGREREESLNIIHHPDGDLKQLSIRENLFTKITPTTIWYEADTAQGSSGGPVFNDQWQVVALHHLGVAAKNDEGDYIDKQGNPINLLGGKIQESKINWIANEGIRISVILEDIFTAFPSHLLVAQLKNKNEGAESATVTVKEIEIQPPLLQSPSLNLTSASDTHVQVTIPAHIFNQKIPFNLHISNHCATPSTISPLPPTPPDDPSVLELKKLEESMDFSGCQGYLPNFLGRQIALPEPGTTLKKFIAVLKGSSNTELKYYHYSVRQHSVRKMPAISAVNVDGNAAVRLDNYKRKDNWLRDNRLDFGIQLDDTFYRNSGFDRGHMSRREDADWGKNAEEAKRNADLTCMHTNACPQIGTLNQSSRKGLWGLLELTVLETGALTDGAETNKISVFNGPIFKADDPVFRGIQIPMDFYKIILWPTASGHIKATAFVLSQSKLVKDISFEQLDIDQNEEFKLYQYPIAKLAEDTGLDFSQLIEMDTYKPSQTQQNLDSTQELKAIFNIK